MRYELFDYQRIATTTILGRLRRAREDWINHSSPSAFALSAIPGAGKTVIATAVIEAMLHGSKEYETPRDQKAAFLWITDAVALNRQTRNKMLTASHMLDPSQLIELNSDYVDPELLRGRVYFLNIQQLSRSARFGQGGRERGRSGWDIIANTISNKDVDLYLVLDEAHRGMKQTKGRGSIVQRLISGQHGTNPSVPAPVVWGISATTDRFTKAMERHERTIYPAVDIDIDKVRASGLVKDQIELDEPSGSGTYSTTLLRAAAEKTLEFERLWADYASEHQERTVLPILVVQVPNKPSHVYLAELISVIEQTWPILGPDAIVNVFGEQDDSVIGNRKVRWVRPESIEEDRTIRVVLAKDAISTGWDCPRAEVMFSDRPAKDATHIAQMIGRMVRTPLAQRIPNEDALNSVSCYLPWFDRTTLGEVIENLTKPGEPGSASEVVVGARLFSRNPDLDQEVFQFIERLPSWPKPDELASPLTRAKKCVKLLTTPAGGQALLPDAGELLTLEINRVLAGLDAKHVDVVEANIQDIESLDVRTVAVRALNGKSVESTKRSIQTADRDIDRYTRRIINSTLKEDIGPNYVKYLIEKAGGDLDIMGMRIRAAALFTIEEVASEVETATTNWVRKQLAVFDAELKNTTGKTFGDYIKVRDQASEQETNNIHLPTTIKSPTKTSNAPDADNLPTFNKHLFVDTDDDNLFPANLNKWEKAIIDTETKRRSCLGWYRNPDYASIRSHSIGYCSDDKWKNFQIDFLVISRKDDGTLGASIIDPHGDYLSDAKPKLQALARFADKFGDQYVRIQSINEIHDKTLRSLDLLEPEVRSAVEAFREDTVSPLYKSEIARDYK